MSTFSDAIATGFASMQSPIGDSISFTASGSSAKTITGIWTPDESNMTEGDYQQEHVESGTLQISTADIETVTVEADTAVIDGSTYTVMSKSRSAGLWILQLERSDTQRSYVGQARL